jgi:hypothetical protein
VGGWRDERSAGGAGVFGKAQQDASLGVEIQCDPADPYQLVEGRPEIAVGNPQGVGDVVQRATEIAAGDGVQDAPLGDDRSKWNLHREIRRRRGGVGEILRAHVSENDLNASGVMGTHVGSPDRVSLDRTRIAEA